MSGSDTWRGINFQGACTVSLALDFLEHADFETLQVEGAHKIEDASILPTKH